MATATKYEIWMRLPQWDPDIAARLERAGIELAWREAPGEPLVHRPLEVRLLLDAADWQDARRQVARVLDDRATVWLTDFITVSRAGAG
jgi:hypothetical protein